MPHRTYHFPKGGLPSQSELAGSKSVFKTAYAVIDGHDLTDIVTSQLPFWANSRFWFIAKPMSGFAQTFSYAIAELSSAGGSDRPETDPMAQSALFVLDGKASVTIEGKNHILEEGGFAFIPAGSTWTVWNQTDAPCRVHWLRKKYQPLEGLAAPDVVIASDQTQSPQAMPNTDDSWATTRFIDPTDVRYDMNVNIVTFQPGGSIPFMETHVMEHGLFVLEGKAVYKLNEDWVEVQAGDFMWLRAFCPQACYAGGPGPFRYLLYKDVNRQMSLG